MKGAVCPSVCLSHIFYYVPIIVSSWNFQELLPMTEVMSMQKFKVGGQRSRSQRLKNKLAISEPWLQFEFTYDEMMPYCFSMSYVKFQGHAAKKKSSILTQICRFNSSLNSPMAAPEFVTIDIFRWSQWQKCLQFDNFWCQWRKFRRNVISVNCTCV